MVANDARPTRKMFNEGLDPMPPSGNSLDGGFAVIEAPATGIPNV
jgi:hypothetical protein